MPDPTRDQIVDAIDTLGRAVAASASRELVPLLSQIKEGLAALAATPLLIERREAGKRLDISARTVDALIADGKIHALRIGKRVLLSVAELQRFVDREMSASAPVNAPRPDVVNANPLNAGARSDPGRGNGAMRAAG